MYSGIIQASSEPLVTLAYLVLWYMQNPDIFKTLRYSQPWYIQNQSIFRTLVYSKSEAYSEPYQIYTIKRFVKIVNGYNYFRETCRALYFMKYKILR